LNNETTVKKDEEAPTLNIFSKIALFHHSVKKRTNCKTAISPRSQSHKKSHHFIVCCRSAIDPSNNILLLFGRKNMTSSPSTSVKRRSVSFKGTVLVHGVLHLNDYRKEEVNACWYDRDGIENIRKEARRTVKLFQQQEESGNTNLSRTSCSDSDNCIHGLESFTKSGMAEKLRRRQDAINLVLDTQGGQCGKSGRITNANAIADAYRMVSETAERIARVRGVVTESELGILLKADQSRDALHYIPMTISAFRCELDWIKESRKRSDQTGWTNIVSQAA
jgi:hypothetical protein